MIRSFTRHLEDNTKVYEFKIRMAIECTPELLERIEVALDAYQLESISKPKRLPIQEDTINFPALGPIEISLFDVTLGYPVISEAIETLLSERAGIPTTHMSVYTKAQEADRTPAITELEDKEALLNTDYEEVVQEDVYGNEYISKFLDEIDTREFEIAGDNTEDMKTTNDLPQGTHSPMTQQNKVPTAEDL